MTIQGKASPPAPISRNIGPISRPNPSYTEKCNNAPSAVVGGIAHSAAPNSAPTTAASPLPR